MNQSINQSVVLFVCTCIYVCMDVLTKPSGEGGKAEEAVDMMTDFECKHGFCGEQLPVLVLTAYA